MTTKLYGGDKRLFTAAEARRIDIERGGEGWIQDLNGDKFFYREDRMDWSYTKEALPVLLNGLRQCWLPVTPEPEPIVLDYLVLVDANERIKQLEKELAEYKDNYHEILADHGELTRKFDELTEKARWKSCKKEIPKSSFRIKFKPQGSYPIEESGIYQGGWKVWLSNEGWVKISSDIVETWTWKYEADL